MTPSAVHSRIKRFGAAWNKYSLWPLIALALLLAVLLTIPALVDGAQIDLNGSDSSAEIARAIAPFVWAVFVIDVLIRFATAPSRRKFLREEWLEVVAIGLPYLPHMHVLQLLSVFIIIASRLRTRVTNRIVIYVVSISIISWFVLGLGITESEGIFDHPISNLGDGLWWSFELLATGNGFDETFPTTEAGRVLGVFGFLLSYAVVGGITAALVAWLVSMGRREDDEEILSELEEDSDDIAALHNDVRALREELAALRSDLTSTSGQAGSKVTRTSVAGAKPRARSTPKDH